jgi:LytS/YehU family sensor histidine kinase
MNRDTEKRKIPQANTTSVTQKILLNQAFLKPAQLDAHFIFNTLAMIQGHVLKSEPTEANRTLENFSGLLHNLINFSEKTLIPLSEEIGMLEKYLAIEKDRLGGTLEYTLLIEATASSPSVLLPPLLTQPFVENAIRHGLMHREGTKHLDVSFRVDNGALIIKIDDDGIGRKASHDLYKLRQPLASFAALTIGSNLRKRKSGKYITLQTIDKHHVNGMPSGTTVLLTLPLTYDC